MRFLEGLKLVELNCSWRVQSREAVFRQIKESAMSQRHLEGYRARNVFFFLCSKERRKDRLQTICSSLSAVFMTQLGDFGLIDGVSTKS